MLAPPMPIQNRTLSSSSEFGDAYLQGETKKVQDDSSLFFTSTSLYEFENSVLNDTLPYHLTGGVIDFPIDPPRSNILDYSPDIQEGKTSIENWISLSRFSSLKAMFSSSSTHNYMSSLLPMNRLCLKVSSDCRSRPPFVTIHGKPVKHFCPVAVVVDCGEVIRGRIR
jgi:hypothetical protein